MHACDRRAEPQGIEARTGRGPSGPRLAGTGAVTQALFEAPRRRLGAGVAWYCLR